MDITDTNNLVWEDGMSDPRDIATLCKEIDYLTEQVNRLRARGNHYKHLFTFWLKQATVIRNERDEARREVCKAESGGRIGRFGTAQEHAERMGLDCFKSDILSQEVSQEREQQ